MWFNEARPYEKFQQTPKLPRPTESKKQFEKNYIQIPILYKYLFAFKGGYAIEMNTLNFFRSLFIDTNF